MSLVEPASSHIFVTNEFEVINYILDMQRVGLKVRPSESRDLQGEDDGDESSEDPFDDVLDKIATDNPDDSESPEAGEPPPLPPPAHDPVVESGPKGPLVPHEVRVEEDRPVVIAERMPHLATCEDIVDNHVARKQCADAKLMQYINKQIRYPQMAMDAGCQGTAIVSFVVGKKGELESLKV